MRQRRLQHERPGFINDGAVLAAVNARSAPPAAVALRPALTDAARGAFPSLGRGGETPLSLTKKRSAVRCGAKGEAFDGFRAG